jgi:hypothetical protein
MAEETEEGSSYDPTLDVLLGQEALDAEHSVQLRQYEDGDVKVCIVKARNAKSKKVAPMVLKRFPVALLPALHKAIGVLLASDEGKKLVKEATPAAAKKAKK